MKYILLHGLGQTSSSWNKTLDVMNDKWDIECPNLVDWLYNESSCYETLYKALERYCEQFDEPLSLCGLSLGGILAIQYSIEHSEKIDALVLIGTQYAMPKKLLKIQNIMFQFMPKSMFSKMGFQKSDFISLCKSMIDLDFSYNLKDICCRVLVLCGEKDRANKTASIDIQKKIPHAKISIISGAGHEVNIDAPIKLGNELNDFFDCPHNNEKQKVI